MRKIKISSIATALVVFLMFFVSCTNEELVPNEPDGPVLSQGRIVFNVNTGKSMVCTRASAEDEQAIRSLGVFIVKPDGNLAEGVTRFYESQVLTGNKLAVSIPVDIMETPGVKVYLVANGPNKAQCDGLKTEQEVLGLVATTKPEEISTKGIPMACGAISLNFTGGIATVDANMKRVMSTLCATVIKSKGVIVGPDDFTFKAHGISGKEGYCFKDECKDTGVDQVWSSTSKTPGEEVSLGYFYQSKGFQVEVVSKSTGQSRTVEISPEKAQVRNKKYMLKIHPSPVSEGKGEFKVTVEEWAQEDPDVYFDKDLVKFKNFERFKNGEFWLDDEAFDNIARLRFLSFADVASGFKLVNWELNCLDEQKKGLRIIRLFDGRPAIYPTRSRSLKQVDGVLTGILEDENGVRFRVPFPIHVLPSHYNWIEGFEQNTDDASFKVVDGVLVCTITNDSAKKLSVSKSSVQVPPGGGVVDSCDELLLVFNGVNVMNSKGEDIRLTNDDNIEIEFNKSLKGCEALLYVSDVSGEIVSCLWMYFE